MGLRRCLFQIKRRKKDEKIRSINSGRGADTCFVGGVPESKYGRDLMPRKAMRMTRRHGPTERLSETW